MNPTDEVDDLLTRAGARWRADQPSAPEPDLERMLAGRRRPRGWVPALAAASVAAIAAAALTVLPDNNNPAPSAVPPQSVAQSKEPEARTGQTQPSNDDLLIRPGDKVRVNGDVIVVPGKAPVFCPPLFKTAIGYPPGQEPAPSCPDSFAVTLKGVDLGRISGLKTTKGVQSGQAELIGIWGDRSIDVQEQKPYAVPTNSKPLPPLPCAAPAGGWVSKPSNVNSTAVINFLAAHADQIFGPVMHYPNGSSRGAPVVVMIGVAHGDLDAFRAAFEKVYQGNLCVTPVLLSRSDNERISNQVGDLMSRKELAITSSSGSGLDGGRAIVQMVAYTEQVKAALTPVGLDVLEVAPAVKPAE
ncbi:MULTISPECIES: hypothetical protein [unclassified Kribbella]|uniref:hypothetical protein n=1 Tax=unclassified Kribbella TaxID=2644121 RepID=UPI0030159D4A